MPQTFDYNRRRIDPRELMAMTLMQEGTSTAPVQHWTQGLARMAQAGLGGYMQSQIRKEAAQKQQAASDAMMRALGAMQGQPGRPGGVETTPGGTSIDWNATPATPPNMGQAAQILASNPDTQGQAWQLQIAEQQRQQAEAQREQARQQQLQDIEGQRGFQRETLGMQQNFSQGQQDRLFAQQKALEGMREARGANAQWLPMPNPADPNLPPVLIDQRTGNMKPIPGTAMNTRAMTEGQANAALYADRMREAEKIITDPRIADVGTSLTERAKSAVPVLGNYMVSDEFQQLDQAQRDFINAVLRRESGAVISDPEFANAKRQYFPQPGDRPEVLAQKAANRQTALSGISRAAGPTYGINQQRAGGGALPAPAPAAGGGIKFLGFE